VTALTAAPPARPPAPSAPPGVLAAAYLIAGAAACWISAAIAGLFAIAQYTRHYTDLRQDPSSGKAVAALFVTGAVLAVLAAAPTILLAVLDAQGRPAARVLTWIFSVVGLAVAAAVLLLDMFTALPWYRWVTAGTAVATLLFLLAGGILLMTPPAGRYFRAARDHRAAARPVPMVYPPRPFYPAQPPYPPPPQPPYPPR
jgi:hypothetical protein